MPRFTTTTTLPQPLMEPHLEVNDYAKRGRGWETSDIKRGERETGNESEGNEAGVEGKERKR